MIMSLVTMQEVDLFMTMLVNWGGKFTVDDDHLIRRIATGELEQVEINKTHRALMVPHEGMRQNPDLKSTNFMPLIETVGHTIERKWFFTEYRNMISEIVWNIMQAIVDGLVVTDDKVDCELSDEAMGLIRPFYRSENDKDRMDETTLKELQSIAPDKLLRYVYNRRARTSQLQTQLYEDEYVFGQLKLRKKTARMFRLIFAEIMSSEQIHKDYTHSAVELGMPSVECFLNIMAMYSKSLAPYAKHLLGVELFPDELEFYCEDLKPYRKCCSHLIGTSLQSDKDEHETTSKGKTELYEGGVQHYSGGRPTVVPAQPMVVPNQQQYVMVGTKPKANDGTELYEGGGPVTGWGRPTQPMLPPPPPPMPMPQYGGGYGMHNCYVPPQPQPMPMGYGYPPPLGGYR